MVNASKTRPRVPPKAEAAGDMNRLLSYLNRFFYLSLIALGLPSGCTPNEPPGSPLDTGVLQVATRNGSTTYYLDRHENPAGPEYALINDYAAARGWKVEWTQLGSIQAVLEALEAGRTHLAAAGLTHTESRDARFTRGPAHTEITEQLVCHRKNRPLPRKPEAMAGLKILVTAEASYVETLQQLASKHPGIEYSEDSERTTEMLLAAVAEGELDCTLADSNIVQIMRRHFPSLEVAMDLTEGRNLGWYLPAEYSGLASDAHKWMNSRAGDEAIGRMENRYYSYINEFDFVDLRALKRRIEKRLPQFIEAFRAAEQETGMPADLLAALSYQESHWDPKAVSPTGVRGIMMLTRSTAKELGVKQRLNPDQAIAGGARYLADRHSRLPETIPEPDRTFLALASYNIGRGHLLDARSLARELGKNPNNWSDMEQVLPLKADKRYYPSTRYGYARGYEPVHYVRRIRNYRDVIRPHFQ